MNTITIQVRTVYGNDVIYPACPRSVIFARIAGTKTLTPQALRDIQALGYEIEVSSPTLSFATGMGRPAPVLHARREG